MSHLEALVAEYYAWKGYFIKRNEKVGRRSRGGWEMELDIVAYDPKAGTLLHLEPSLDALSWEQREKRFAKKFAAGRKYILRDVLPWLPVSTIIDQVAILITHPSGRDEIAGGRIQSVDEFLALVRAEVVAQGAASRAAISEGFPMLRALQLSHNGYYQVL